MPHFLHGELLKRKKGFLFFVFLYVSIFLSANFVGDREVRLFYFQCSLGTLLIQIAFSALIIFTEIVGFVRTAKIITYTCLLNLIVALLVYFNWGYIIPEFWVEKNVDSSENWRQIKIICLLTGSFFASTLLMTKAASWVKKWLMGNWLLIRIFLVTVVGLCADILFLIPILLLVAPNQYMAYWKMFALLSVKSVLSLLGIPAIYLIIQLFKSNTKGAE